MLEAAVIAGITSEGVDALRVGVLPTPAVAYLTHAYDAEFGVMISASHNPMPDNGIKIFGAGGHKLDDATEDRIEELRGRAGRASGRRRHRTGRRCRRRARPLPPPRRKGTHHPAGRSDRRRRLCARLRIDRRAAGIPCAGANVIAINAEPNGLNINDGCGSTHMDALRQAVRTAPTSAWPTTATPTAAWSSTRAMSSTATPSW